MNDNERLRDQVMSIKMKLMIPVFYMLAIIVAIVLSIFVDPSLGLAIYITTLSLWGSARIITECAESVLVFFAVKELEKTDPRLNTNNDE